MRICGTGHRQITEKGLESKIERYIIDNDVHYVITGMALGFDQILANAAISLKDSGYDIHIEAAIPCENQTAKWSMSDKLKYHQILNKCDKITYVAKEYTATCMQDRNEYMVNNSDVVLAYYDGRDFGGTKNCIRYAKSKNKHIDNLYSVVSDSKTIVKDIYNAKDLMKVPNGGIVKIKCKDGNGVVSIINFLYHTENTYYVLTKNCGKKRLTVEYMQKYVMSVLNGRIDVYVPSSDKARKAVLISIKNLITSEEDRSFTKYTKWVGDGLAKCDPIEAEVVEECIRIAKIRNRITFNLKGIEDKDFIKTYHQCSKMGLLIKFKKPEIDITDTTNRLLDMFDNYNTDSQEDSIEMVNWMYEKTKEEPELLIDFLPLRNDYMKLCDNLNLLGYSRQVILDIINKLYEQDRLINMPERFSESAPIDFNSDNLYKELYRLGYSGGSVSDIINRIHKEDE